MDFVVEHEHQHEIANTSVIIIEHYMNGTEGNYSCGYHKPGDVHWIRQVDLVIGIFFMMVSIATLLINTFVIYTFITSNRKLQGTSLILLQVAANDFISGIIGMVFCTNLLTDRSLSVYVDSKVGNAILCQTYAVLLDIIYITAPLLLAIATALRVFAVLSPYKYQKINTTYKVVPIGLSGLSWSFGLCVGLFPFFFGKYMCYMQVSGSCDYFVINVLGGDTDRTRMFSLFLFVIPGNIAYFIIVMGGFIVIAKLFRQNRKTLARTTSRMETVQSARSAFTSRANRRASDSELRMMQKELSVIKCTLALCATYFVAHFVTVSYNVVYMFRTDNSVFRTMSGNSQTGEVYLYAWFYLSHTMAGFVDGLVQVQCNNDMKKGMKSLISKVTSFVEPSEMDFKGSVFNSINRFSTILSSNNGRIDLDHPHSEPLHVSRNNSDLSEKYKLSAVNSLPEVTEQSVDEEKSREEKQTLDKKQIPVDEQTLDEKQSLNEEQIRDEKQSLDEEQIRDEDQASFSDSTNVADNSRQNDHFKEDEDRSGVISDSITDTANEHNGTNISKSLTDNSGKQLLDESTIKSYVSPGV